MYVSDEQWKNIALEFSCQHHTVEMRERTVRGGGKQYVYQCLRCGEPTSNPIAKSRAFSICDGPIKDFDDNLRKRFSERRKQAIESAKNQNDAEFWDWYSQYLRTDKWRDKRAAVLRRANGACEGCGLSGATQVHHLTYEHVGDEFLWELVAICDACHERAHVDDKD